MSVTLRTMKTIQARIDESVEGLIRNLKAIVGEVALDALARRMQQKPRRPRRAAEQVHRKPEETWPHEHWTLWYRCSVTFTPPLRVNSAT